METFFETIGKDVLHLNIKPKFNLERFPSILKFFPKLETLSLIDFEQLNIFIETFPDTLETLIVYYLSTPFEIFLTDKIPKLKSVIVTRVHLSTLINHDQTQLIHADERLKSMLTAINVKHDPLIRTNLNHFGRRKIRLEHVTYLNCTGPKEKLSEIGQKLVNLTTLTYCLTDGADACFFGHGTIEGFKKITNLCFIERDHEVYHKLCDKCLEAFLNTFKNVRKLELHSALNQNQVNLILENLEKLRKVILVSYNMESLFNFQLVCIPKLEKLKIWSKKEFSLTDETFAIWPWMPNLRNLTISSQFENVSSFQALLL